MNVFSSFVVNTFLLMIRLFLAAVSTCFFKAKENSVVNEEDRILFKMPPMKSGSVDYEGSKSARIVRVHRNDLENILPFFMVCVCVVWLSENGRILQSMEMWVSLAMYAFTVARYVYLYAYLYAWQPYRTYMWLLGMFATLFIGGVSVVSIL